MKGLSIHNQILLFISVIILSVRKVSGAGDGSPGYGVKLIGAATYYGGGDGGNCGYAMLDTSGYSRLIAAGSPGLYKNGEGCGACYKIKCINSKYCKSASLIVPITDACFGCNACGPNCQHFDLSTPAFDVVADRIAGIIPLQYERVPCRWKGDIKFWVTGSAYWLNVHPRNVAGPGDMDTIYVKPANGGWIQLQHDWGANWIHNGFLQAPLNFRVVSRLDGQILTTQSCLPLNWQSGSYSCGVQFAIRQESKSPPKSPPKSPKSPPKSSKSPPKLPPKFPKSPPKSPKSPPKSPPKSSKSPPKFPKSPPRFTPPRSPKRS